MNIAVLGGHYLKSYRGDHQIWTYDLPLTINTGEDNSVFTLLSRKCPFSPDAVLFGDQGCFPMITGLEDLKIPIFAYLIDTHLHYSWHRNFAGVFDHVFVAQRDCALSIAGYNPACDWTPLFSRLGDIRLNIPKKYDVTFVGTVDSEKNADRVKFLDSFSRQMHLNIFSGEYIERFNASQIILNQSVANDINFRVFEALASGSLLLTDDIGNGLDLLFENGCHLVTYQKNNVDDAVAKARYYLANPVERERIAAEGHRLVIEKHTLEIRIQQILEKMKTVFLQYVPDPGRQRAKKRAAGSTFLSIAQLMSHLEALHKNDYYGCRIGWFLKVARDNIMHSLTAGMSDEGIIKDLAILYFLENDLNKSALHAKMSLLANPEDMDMLLLAAEIEHNRGEYARSKSFFARANELLQNMARNSVNILDINELTDSMLLCGKRLSLL